MKLGFPRGSEIFHPHPDSQVVALTGKRLPPFRRRAMAFILDFGIATTVFVLVAGPVAALLERTGRSYQIHFGFFDNWYSIVWMVAYLGLGHYRSRGTFTLGLEGATQNAYFSKP